MDSVQAAQAICAAPIPGGLHGAASACLWGLSFGCAHCQQGCECFLLCWASAGDRTASTAQLLQGVHAAFPCPWPPLPCRYKLVYIPSSGRQTQGGITDAQNNAFVQRRADLVSFVNTLGGSLIALTQVRQLMVHDPHQVQACACK